jgi:hypothetical protein
MNLILEKIVMNVKKIFNIVFSDIEETKKIKMLENIIGEDLTTLNNYWDTFVYEFQVYRSNRLKSSNVKYVNYNSDTQVMTITFNNNSVYEYYNVSMLLYLQVRNGLAAAKTTGKNKFGEWFKGKFPSNGAAVWRYLRNTGVSYRKIK